MHIEFLVEEPSAEAFLQGVLPTLLDRAVTYRFHTFQGKPDLLKKLPERLKGYRTWIPQDYRVVVLVDEDRQDCHALKEQLEAAAATAGLATKSRPAHGAFTVLNRLAVEEIEAWYFGEMAALCKAYKGISPTLAAKSAYRDPDAIKGGTWEALERELQRAGHFLGGLRKVELARTVAPLMTPADNRSVSFQHFVRGLRSL